MITTQAMKIRMIIAAALLTFSSHGLAAASGKSKAATTAPLNETAKPATDNDPGYAVRSSTKIDFSEANIEGRMKAPEGFFLQGRKSQDLQNLLKLRANFREELAGSAAAAEIPAK